MSPIVSYVDSNSASHTTSMTSSNAHSFLHRDEVKELFSGEILQNPINCICHTFCFICSSYAHEA